MLTMMTNDDLSTGGDGDGDPVTVRYGRAMMTMVVVVGMGDEE